MPDERIAGMGAIPGTNDQPSWYESNLLWGALTLAVGIILAVVPAIRHDLSWLLWCSWPLFGVAIWSLARRTREVFLVSVLGIALIGSGLLWLSRWLQPEQISDVTLTPKPIALTIGQTGRSRPTPQFPKSPPFKQKSPRQSPTLLAKPPVAAPASPELGQLTISAPNGIAIGGGSVTNPIVNNFGCLRPVLLIRRLLIGSHLDVLI